MEKFYENSDFSIYTDKKNEIIDFFDKQRNIRITHMINKLDEALIDTMSNELLLKAKQAIDIELNRRINNGDFK